MRLQPFYLPLQSKQTRSIMNNYQTSRGVEYSLDILSRSENSIEVLAELVTGEQINGYVKIPRSETDPTEYLSDFNTMIDAKVCGEIARRAQEICVRKSIVNKHWKFNFHTFNQLSIEFGVIPSKYKESHTAHGLEEITELLEILEK